MTIKESHKLIKQGIEKVVVSVGVGNRRSETGFEDKVLPDIENGLSLITGQKPQRRPARKSIAGFKVREGEVVGLRTSLRDKKMTAFLSKVIHVIYPRVRDFRGINIKNVDENGNLNLGLRDVFVFPEIDADKFRTSFGLQITVVPYAKNRDSAIELYRRIGIPLKAV